MVTWGIFPSSTSSLFLPFFELVVLPDLVFEEVFLLDLVDFFGLDFEAFEPLEEADLEAVFLAEGWDLIYSPTFKALPFLSFTDLIFPSLSLVTVLPSESFSTVPPSGVVSISSRVSSALDEDAAFCFLDALPPDAQEHPAISEIINNTKTVTVIILFIMFKNLLSGNL